MTVRVRLTHVNLWYFVEECHIPNIIRWSWIHNKKDLKFLGKTDENVDMAETAITEFKKHGIMPEQLQQEIEKQQDIYLKNKLQENK